MLLRNLELTINDFINSDWQTVILDVKRKDCWKYVNPFFIKAQDAKDKGDDIHREIFLLFGYISSLNLDLDSPRQPFRAYTNSTNFHSPSLDDIPDRYFDILAEIINDIQDNEFKARIADILWVKRHKPNSYEKAILAIDSYLASATILEDPDHWSASTKRIQRALQISTLLGSKKNVHFDKVICYIQEILDKYEGEDISFLSLELMELLQQCREGDPKKYSLFAAKAAERAEKNGEWRKARMYWNVKADWHTIEDNIQERFVCQYRTIDTYIKEADHSISSGRGYAIAAHFIRDAIEALRRMGNQQDYINRLHIKLLEYQEKSISEIKIVSTFIDIGEMVQNAIKMVQDKPFYESLMILAFSFNSPEITQIKEDVERSAKKYPLRFIIPAVILDHSGRKTGSRSGIDADDEEKRKMALEAEMFRRSVFYQNLNVQAKIEPIRNQIMIEHNPSMGDILQILSNNPFIPPGREFIYAQAIHSGLTGDFLVSAHLLVAQIENSIRYILYRFKGIPVSNLSTQGVQDEPSINTIFDNYENELIGIFGENLVFDLRSLLVERFGSNLRNKVAHGLLDANMFSSSEMAYLWWIALHLCFQGIYAQIRTLHNSSTDDSTNSNNNDVQF